MKDLKDKINETSVNEVRRPVNYGQQSTIICNEEELDELSDIIRAGAESKKFDLEAKKNQYSLVVSLLELIETIGAHDDEVKITLFKKDAK